MARSGAQEFSDDKQRAPLDSPLHRLNGIMLITSLLGARSGHWNVEFAVTRCPARRMSFRLLRALAEIKMGTARGKFMTRKASLDPGRREQRIEVDICKIRIAGLKMAKCGL
jgi:hypothetical protein